MTNDCTRFESLIARAAEAGAPDAPAAWPMAPADRDRLQAHLAACGECRAALAAQAEVRALLAARPPDMASGGFRARVRLAVEAEAHPAMADLLDFRRWTWRLAPVAAAAVLAATLGLAQTTSGVLDTETMTESAAALPASAALYSTTVTDETLLGLMLSANADDPLGAVDQVQR